MIEEERGRVGEAYYMRFEVREGWVSIFTFLCGFFEEWKQKIQKPEGFYFIGWFGFYEGGEDQKI